MMHKPFALAVLAIAVLPFLAVAGQPTALPVQTLVAKSELVLTGTVISKTVQRDPDNRIYTRIEFQVTEVWKGSLATNRFVTVHGGGILGDERVEVSGQVEYEIGEEIVGFYVLNPRGEGVSIGLAQGKFHVYTDPSTGEKLAHNSFHGKPAPAASTALTGSGPTAAQSENRLTLADLKHRVAEAAK